MNLKGFTLAETIISLAIIAIIALSTSAGFSSAGDIFRRSSDIKEISENSAEKLAELYTSENYDHDRKCSLKINDKLTLYGEFLDTESAEGSDYEFSGYMAVRPYERTVDDEKDE